MPELIAAYAAFAATSQSGSPRQPFKGWDLWQQLERCQPKSIVELGSGTTSAVFALWVKRHGGRYVCFEHHSDWARVTEDCLRAAGLIADSISICTVPTRVGADGTSVGFTEPIPSDAEFIYVDGPPCVLDNGTKVPNDDVYRVLEQNVRPRMIVVDGRIATVELIKKHPAMAEYAFEPGYHYSLRSGGWKDIVAADEHSAFTLLRDSR